VPHFNLAGLQYLGMLEGGVFTHGECDTEVS
jgi:hypothetical protein